MKKHKETTDILIVGAGPVGMLSAFVLAAQGREVMILDQAPGPCAHSYGLALHRPILMELQKLGLLEDVMSLAYPLERMGLYDERMPVRTVVFDEIFRDCGVPFLVTLSQADFENLLLDRLRALGVSVVWAHRAAGMRETERTVTVTVQELEEHLTGYAVAHFESMVATEQTISARWVLACDGWRSPTRRSLRIDWKLFSQPTEFAFFEFETWTDQHYELTLALEGEKTHVSWPLGPHFARWCFELPLHPANLGTREKAREYVFVGGFPYASPERAVFDRLLEQAAPGLGSPPERLRWRVVVPFAKAMAESFSRGHVILLGDAAHTMMPGGVQNMNSALLEAIETATAMATHHGRHAAAEMIADQLAQRAEVWRERLHPSGKITLDADHRLEVLPDQALAVFENLPATGEDLVALAKAMGLELPPALEHALMPLASA